MIIQLVVNTMVKLEQNLQMFLSTSGVTEVSLNELKEMIKSSKPSKASGPDGILNLILIKNVNFLPHSLVKLVNSCLKISYFPKSWKNANIMFF